MADLVVHPQFKVPCYTYVLAGVLDGAGVGGLVFRNLCVPEIDGIALEVGGPGIYLSSTDHADVNQVMVEWADSYGKVNLAPDTEHSPGLAPLGPIFGIRLWPKAAAYQIAARMTMAGAPALPTIRQVRFQAITMLPLRSTRRGPPTNRTTCSFARAVGARSTRRRTNPGIASSMP